MVGAGAVGGYFGARLAQAGRNVSFLVRRERADALRQRGLRVRSPHGDFKVEPTLVTRENPGIPYDLVLVSVKAYALDEAMADFASAVGPGTSILPLLNGLRHLDLLQARFGPAAVLGGTAVIFADVDQERRIVQYAPSHILTFGEVAGGSSERIRAIEAALGGAGFETRSSTDIMQAMWEKWIALASLGALNTLVRGTVGEVAAVPGGREMAVALVQESAAIATACGHPPTEQVLRRHIEVLTDPESSLTSSMYRDLRRGAAVEGEHILGDLHRRGAERGIASPLIMAALVALRVYEGGLRRR